ncbi:MAG: hypothetical protein IJ705_02765, partial [Oscillospiraceae bacterium]|nr:hypothetical protein [Oscillospiraceae bacterium]
LVLALLLALGAAAWFGLGLGRGMAAWRLLGSYATADELSMELSVTANLDGRRYRLDTDLYRMTVDGKRIMAVERAGLIYWYCDGLVCLENGKTYSAGSLFPENTALLEDVLALYRELNVRVFDSRGEKIYTITVGGAAAEQILESLLPLSEDSFREVSDVDLELVERGGTLYALRIRGSGVLEGGTPAEVAASLLLDSGNQIPELPQAVRTRLTGGEAQTEPFDEDLLRLLTAWVRLKISDTLTIEASLSANCGPLFLDDTLEWSRYYSESGEEINRIRKNGVTLYASPGEEVVPRHLCQLAYRLCMLGDMELTQEEDETLRCTVNMDADAMTELFNTLLPEGGSLNVALSAGTVEVLLRDWQITQITLNCGGTVQLLAVSAPASLAAKLIIQAQD